MFALVMPEAEGGLGGKARSGLVPTSSFTADGSYLIQRLTVEEEYTKHACQMSHPREGSGVV